MALATCKECGRQVSTQAKACPGCGGPPPKTPPQKITWKGWTALFLVGWIVFSVYSNTDETAASQQAGAKAKETQNAAREEQSRQWTWVSKGKEAVKQRLKDPDSAQFRNVYFHRGKSGVPVACGQVNAKNSMGGYSGFQRFVSGTTVELTYLEKEVVGFAKVWNELCAN
ncbi:MAG: hypothetical protein K5880_11695 [Hydrogenophaga sp.]|uniref:hypothetical protein n=1 Tax=Hydrogenophaga sp. TaxID=1904254 RepID=UPI00260DD0DA|nr:hypothetical protein [Hydrogenophaga sp.]MCV0439289.1 hypothetical protein [Hydrogenophaga sp.]